MFGCVCDKLNVAIFKDHPLDKCERTNRNKFDFNKNKSFERKPKRTIVRKRREKGMKKD